MKRPSQSPYAPKRTPEQVAAAREWLSAQLVERPRVSQYRLARELSTALPGMPEISQRQISRDVEAIHAEWSRSRIRNKDIEVGRELALLDWVQAEAVAAYQRSKQDKRIETVEEDAAQVPPLQIADIASADQSVRRLVADALKAHARARRDRRRSGLRIEQRDPAAEFLSIILRVSESRRKLLGIDAPEQVDLTLFIREQARLLGLNEDEEVLYFRSTVPTLALPPAT